MPDGDPEFLGLVTLVSSTNCGITLSVLLIPDTAELAPFHPLTITDDFCRLDQLHLHHRRTSYNVLLQWPSVPDSLLLFTLPLTVKPFTSWSPGASDESFIKATVSCVGPSFVSASSGSEGNTKLCEDRWPLSGSSGNRNICIHHWSSWHVHGHMWRSISGGWVYSGRHSVCMQHRRRGARGLDQYSEDWLTESLSSPHKHMEQVSATTSWANSPKQQCMSPVNKQPPSYKNTEKNNTRTCPL